MAIEHSHNRRQFRYGTILAVGALSLGACSDSDPGIQTVDSRQTVCGNELDAPRGSVIVDGRCDSDPLAPVGVYAEPSINGSALGTVATGVELRADCLVVGDTVQDLSESANGEWVRIDFDDGLSRGVIKTDRNVGAGGLAYVSRVWVDGDDRLELCER